MHAAPLPHVRASARALLPLFPLSPLSPLVAFAALAALAGCDTPVADAGPLFNREAWHHVDDPSLIDDDFEYVLDELPTSGEAKQVPWPGSYWPTYRDGINERWDGDDTRSPAEKYAAAFGKSGVEDAVSRRYGVDSLTLNPTCRKDSDCKQPEGSVCAKRRGETTGRCSETWFGICDAWAPAAILEPEPRKAVTYNGVEFKVNDLKALISVSYTAGLEVRYVSLRCNESSKDEDLGDLDQCKDTNPGTFHVVAANLLGLRGESFIEDRTYDYEVWNQPVRSFKVTKDVELTPAQANALLGAAGDDYAFNPKAVSLRQIRTELRWVAESPSYLDGPRLDEIDQFTMRERYDYVLELDADGKIIGGEWLGATRTNHPDFLWRPIKKRDAVAVDVIDYDDIKQLLDQSAEP